MNARQKTRIEMLKRAAAFGRENASLFAPNPPATGPAMAQQLFSELEGVLTQIGSSLTRKQSSAASAGITDKGSLRDALMSDMRAVVRSVTFLSARKGEPAWMERFRVPYGASDTNLIHRARAFVTALQELGLEADLTRLEHAPDFIEVLKGRIAEFEEADNEKDDAMADRAGATATLAALITQGLTVVSGLDAIIGNKFSGNADLLGQWKYSSHVERTGYRPAAASDPSAPEAGQPAKEVPAASAAKPAPVGAA